MGLYNRAAKGKPPNWWIMYTITEPLRMQHGLTTRTVRESGGGGDLRAARSLLGQRKREVRDGTWIPPAMGSSGLLVETYAARWVAGRRKSGVATIENERQRLDDYVLPVIGKRPLAEVSRKEIKALMAKVAEEPSKHTGKPHKPRTVHRIYEAMRTMFNDAVLDEVLVVSQCTLRIKRGELPPKQDGDPLWRAQALFTRDEVETLLSDERVPHQRRMYYGIGLLTGTRLGEISGRRWRDYDPEAQPLGRLLCATQYDDQPLKGQRPAREVPVHPTLAAMLAAWKLAWPSIYGRHATPEDFIVPKRAVGYHRVGITPGAMTQANVWRNLQDDLAALGLRRRRVHDTRRTLTTLALTDGADKYLLRWITHGPQKADAFDSYVSPPWEALCKQISGLRISLRTAKVVRMKRKGKELENG